MRIYELDITYAIANTHNNYGYVAIEIAKVHILEYQDITL